MSSTEALVARYGPAYRWIATVTAMIAAIAVILSATIVNVAIPDVMGAFGISQVEAQWLSTGFLAAMTATMLLTDWTERAFGQRASILAALALFMGGSVLGGLAPDETVLILARVLQGAAAGIVQPLAMIIVFQVFPPGRRPGFDWLGFALLCLFLTTLLSALSNGQRAGWNSDPILLQFALALTAAI